MIKVLLGVHTVTYSMQSEKYHAQMVMIYGLSMHALYTRQRNLLYFALKPVLHYGLHPRNIRANAIL